MTIDHTRILNAYLSRLSTNDIEGILRANYAWQRSAMQHGNSSQLEAQEAFYAAVKHAIGNLIQHDTNHIEKVISEEVTA